jgi:hypothetical protein
MNHAVPLLFQACHKGTTVQQDPETAVSPAFRREANHVEVAVTATQLVEESSKNLS